MPFYGKRKITTQGKMGKRTERWGKEQKVKYVRKGRVFIFPSRLFRKNNPIKIVKSKMIN